jgi:hypothetical protein
MNLSFAKEFPNAAEEIAAELRSVGRDDLARQVPGLRIVERCRCGEDTCGTFYARDAWGNQRIMGKPVHVVLPSGVTVTEVGGVIICVETLNP